LIFFEATGGDGYPLLNICIYKYLKESLYKEASRNKECDKENKTEQKAYLKLFIHSNKRSLSLGFTRCKSTVSSFLNNALQLDKEAP
jgi:hypothetical protein